MTTQYARAVLRISTAQLCKKVGWDSINTTPLEILTDIMQDYIFQLAKLAKEYANLYGRSEVNLNDLGLAFYKFKIDLNKLRDYIQEFKPEPCKILVPKLPIPIESHLNFLKEDSQLLTRPSHIHEHLPPMHPHFKEEKPEANSVISSKMKNIIETEIENIIHEPVCVTMDSEGFISSTVQGKLPVTRLTHKLREESSASLAPAKDLRKSASSDDDKIEHKKKKKRRVSNNILLEPDFKQTHAGNIDNICNIIPEDENKKEHNLNTTNRIKNEEISSNGDSEAVSQWLQNPAAFYQPKDEQADGGKEVLDCKLPSSMMIASSKNVIKLKNSKKINTEDNRQKKRKSKKMEIPQDILFRPDKRKYDKAKKLTGMEKVTKFNMVDSNIKAKSSNLIKSSNNVSTKKKECKISRDKYRFSNLKKVFLQSKKIQGKQSKSHQQIKNSPSLEVGEVDRHVAEYQGKKENKKHTVSNESLNNNITMQSLVTNYYKNSNNYTFGGESPPMTLDRPKTPDICFFSPEEEKKKRKEMAEKPTEPNHKKMRLSISPQKAQLCFGSDDSGCLERPKTPETPEHLSRNKPFPSSIPGPFIPMFPTAPGLIPRPLLPLSGYKNIPGMAFGPPNPAAIPFWPPVQQTMVNKPSVCKNLENQLIPHKPLHEPFLAPDVRVTLPFNMNDGLAELLATSSIASDITEDNSKEHRKEKRHKHKKDKKHEHNEKEENIRAKKHRSEKIEKLDKIRGKHEKIKKYKEKNGNINANEDKIVIDIPKISLKLYQPGMPEIKKIILIPPKKPEEKRQLPSSTLKPCVGPSQARHLEPTSNPYCFKDQNGEEIWICPVCGQEDDGSPMIGCDKCDGWYHWVCVGIQVAPAENINWYCRTCTTERQNKRRKKNTHRHSCKTK